MRDSEVVASIVAGDLGGLGAAYDRYADPLFKYCQTLLRDPANAADAVQDTFVIAATRLGGLRAPERLRSWLYAVARNQSLRAVGARNGGPVLAAASGDCTEVSEGTGRADLRALFDDAMQGLNPGEREVIELQLRAGLAASEIADVLGVSPDHAHTLLSRAREQLETCLGVLLVGRARRDHCAERAAMLSGWDGRLTVVLRKRLHRHIKHCRTCTSMRGYQLRRSLPGLSAGAALTTGAALSFRAAAVPPEGLRGHTLALATGHGPTAAAHSAAVLSRAGEFTRAGFPKPTADAVLGGRHGAVLARRHGAVWCAAHGLKTGLSRTVVRPSSRSQAALTAAGVVAAAVTVAAIGLTGNSQRFTPTADPKTPAAFGPALALAPSTPPASQQTRTTALAPRKPAPATSKATPIPASAPPAVLSVPSPTATSAPPPAKKNTPPTARKSAPPPSRSPSPRPSPPHPTPTPTGTLSAFPAGGMLALEPGAAAQITLSASGGTVNWSIAVGNDPDGAVSVFPDSGTLTAGSPSVTLTVTVSQYLDCGGGPGSPGACPTITISPSGAVYNIWTGPGQQSHGHHHHHGRHSQGSTPVPAATAALNVTAIYLTETRRTAT